MEKLNPCRSGAALAITVAAFYVVCAVAVLLIPEGTFDFFNAWMHGLDLTMLKSNQAMAPGRLVYGFIGITLCGFITGLVFAWSYNFLGRFRCCNS